MPRHLIPIAGLTVHRTWRVGCVDVVDLESAGSELDASTGQRPDEWDATLRDLRCGAVASMDADSFEHARDLASAAVDVLRVFQQVRYGISQTTMFGIAGEVTRSHFPYAVVGDRGGIGFSSRGHHLGWTFNEDAAVEWESSKPFRFAADAATFVDARPSGTRARIGTQLLAQAIIATNRSTQLLAVISALEAMLLTQGGPQKYRLARHVSYFGCGRAAGELCGRDTENCPYLAFDPSIGAERNELHRLRERAQREPGWRCSEWNRLADWYDLRSAVIHGDDTNVEKQGDRALFEALRLTEPILTWLDDHPSDPIGDLEATIRALPPPPDWESIIAQRVADEVQRRAL